MIGRARSVTCDDCTTAPSPGTQLDHGEAGASASREHDRRRDARERRASNAFGRIGRGAVGVGFARVTEPDHQKASARGARGEQLVAQCLEELLANTDVVLLHDRPLPRSRANIDHLAIGPRGVTVIDTKNYTSKIHTETRGGLLRPRTQHLLIAGHDQTKLIDSARRQVAAIATILERAGESVARSLSGER
jgi:ribosomal protein L29